MKSQLHKLQSDFMAAVRFQDTEATAALPINETNGISKETRLEVYGNGFWIRLTRSLKDDFIYTFEKLSEEEIERLIRRFVADATPGFHLLGEVSLAFAKYTADTHPELAKSAALDAAILVSEMDAWPYILQTFEDRLLTPTELAEASTDEVEIAWSTSTQISGDKIVAQIAETLTVLEPSEKILTLVKYNTQIKTFNELIEKLSSMNFTQDEASAAIAFLTQNEILFFLKK